MPRLSGVGHLQDFVIKIHSRCDLACDYCYMYFSADQRWRSRPRSMPVDVVKRTAERIGEHVRAHRPPYVNVILHGGEPLLAGPSLIELAVTAIRREAGPVARMRIQTNGVLLTRSYLRLFDRLRVRVGVSLDGDRLGHDRHRRDHAGHGSHDAVTRALDLLASPDHRHLYTGVLCVVDPANDPITTYEALLASRPPAIDLLLPHANWGDPPRAGYGDWLVAVFDRWYRAPKLETRIRFFEEIMHGLLGGRPRADGLGATPSRVVVVETDGELEGPDSLKSAHESAAATGLSVLRHSFDDVPALAPEPSETCLRCPVHRVCGGGLPAHRYRPGSGFGHPSAYCRDLFRLITHVRDTLARDLEAARPGVR
ncbi:MAG: FxsB family radical SAM/SPASM domain protein [Nonomuraea sp.]|nr:FxsB family radical SAM/SPASM domain protein [Nonomuraea sp.]NUP63737.1 FxsB family radical SAM/SPASM domain protein [Nonomuraea sp.]NUS04580.1 FxsB family radical SAM/SPASM domain protein [Nonomuraea sp.]